MHLHTILGYHHITIPHIFCQQLLQYLRLDLQSVFPRDFFSLNTYNIHMSKKIDINEYMTLTDAIIKRIDELSHFHNIPLPKWSIKAGITPSTVYGIMKKTSGCPRVQTLKLLCDAINISLSDFFDADYIATAICEED